VSTDQDQARLIAERVARRVKEGDTAQPAPRSTSTQNGTPVRQELSAIREGLHDLETKLDRIESSISKTPFTSPGSSRARVIDFISANPPVVKSSQIANPDPVVPKPTSRSIQTTSPWLAGLSGHYQIFEPNQTLATGTHQIQTHPSQERFGVEEAAVSELVEFFENEKKCSLDPEGKPCDHCAMCSSRGF
jgi:hypothetical protein